MEAKLTEQVQEQAEATQPTPEVEESKVEESVQPTEETTEDKTKAKPNSSYLTRINKLTKQKYQKDAEINELRAELDKYKSQVPEKTREDFADDESYIEHKVEAKFNDKFSQQQAEYARAQEEARVEAEKTKSYQERAVEFKKIAPDYDEVLQASEVPMSANTIDFIKTSPKGAEIAYHLAKNPNEAVQLEYMDQRQKDFALIRLETSLEHKQSIPSNPPAPNPKSVEASGIVNLDSVSMDDFVKMRRQSLNK